MPTTITDYLTKHRLNQIKKSITSSESNEAYIHNRSVATKALLSQDLPVVTTTHTGADLSAIFYSMLDKYTGKQRFAHVTTTPKSVAMWGRVAAACAASGVPPHTYMKSQFDYFHRLFGTTPKLTQLATENAIVRAQVFSGSDAAIVGNGIEHKISIGTLFSHCEKQIQDVCKAHKLTREEFYRKFVLTKLLSLPTSFLEADPVYKNL